MKTQVNDIIRDVEVALNEVNPNAASFVGDQDNVDLETRITHLIETTVDEIHLHADMAELALDATVEIHYEGASSDMRFRYKSSTGVLSVLLKSHTDGFADTFDIDMLRLVSVRSKSWPFDVVNVIYPDDPLFEIVTDKYVGAQSDFPAVTQRKRRIVADGQRVVVTALELRCLESESDWAHVSVIPHARIMDGAVEVDRKAYPLVVARIAEKIMKNDQQTSNTHSVW